MNVHLPQSEPTRAELSCLSRVADNFVSSQSSKPVNALCQDTVRGAQHMTRRDTFFTYDEVCQICMWCNEAAREIPPPAIFKPVKLWTGKQIFSMLLPSTLNISGYHSTHPETEKSQLYVDCCLDNSNNNNKSKLFNNNIWNTRFDTRVYIRDGELLTGMICKRMIGQSAGGIVHVIFKDFGPNATRLFMDNISQVVTYFLLHHGASIGIGDAIMSEKTTEDVSVAIQEQMDKIEQIIAKYNTGGSEETDASKMETEIMQCLSKARDTSGKLANKNATNMNNLGQMINSGSKGSNCCMCRATNCRWKTYSKPFQRSNFTIFQQI